MALLLWSPELALASERDGNWWGQLNADRKKSYVLGMMDGISSAQVAALHTGMENVQGMERFHEFMARMLGDVTNDQLVAGLDQVYRDYRNRHLLSHDVFWVAAMELKGATPREVETMLAKLRGNKREKFSR